jgi:hypothetical protein
LRRALRRAVRRSRGIVRTSLLLGAIRVEPVLPSLAGDLRSAEARFQRVAKRFEKKLKGAEAAPASTGPFSEDAAAASEYRVLAQSRFEHIVTVDQPFVLITQVQRSGGTLLMRLFDGHPQCHAIGHELGALLPSALPLPRDCEQAWLTLTDPSLGARFAKGVRQAHGKLGGDASVLPFELPPLLHRALFERCFQRRELHGDRDVMNAYLTAYFNAWLGYQGLERAKQWITGFEPAAIAKPNRLSSFRELYPDGRIISVIREPSSWYASASRWGMRWTHPEVAIDEWRRSVLAATRTKETWPDVVALVPFERLVGDTEATMRALAAFLDIEFTQELVVPSFNGAPTKANSSFPVESAGVIDDPLRRRESLRPEHVELIEAELSELHARALELCIAGDVVREASS